MIDNLYTQRSYVKCISEGYKFLADNLWLVCKVMGPYFLVASALMVVFNVLNTHVNVADAAGKEIGQGEIWADLCFLILAVASYVIAIRRLYVMFRRLCGISGKSRKDFLNKVYVKKALKAFFHHFGKIVGTTLLSLFSVVVCSIIIYLPYVVATYTYFSSVEGEVNFGDTAVIPAYGYAMIFIICTLCYTAIDIVSVAFYATLVFLYGSLSPLALSPSGERE